MKNFKIMVCKDYGLSQVLISRMKHTFTTTRHPLVISTPFKNQA